MTEETKTRATAILEAIKKAGIDLVASLPDINCLDLINALERDSDIIHVPLCREEEGIGICAGARLVGKKPAIVMQNAGLLNSCNGIVTTGIQLELPITHRLLCRRYRRPRFCAGGHRHNSGVGGAGSASLFAA